MDLNQEYNVKKRKLPLPPATKLLLYDDSLSLLSMSNIVMQKT